MKIIQFFLIICVLISCKKENIYYYSNNKQIKDSTVIRFVDKELKKLNLDPQEKNLEIHTTLDSISYKSNLDTIRAKAFELASKGHFIPKDRVLFDKWIREKIIVVDNKTAKVVKFYSTFKDPKFDRHNINMMGMRKVIYMGSILNKSPNAKIPKNYLAVYSSMAIPHDSMKIEKDAVKFLSEFDIKVDKAYYNLNDISFSDVIKIFQTYNRNGIYKQPFAIKNISKKDNIVYTHKEDSVNILTPVAANTIQKCMQYYKDNHYVVSGIELSSVQNLFGFGSPPIYTLIINDKKYTYFIHISGTVVTDLNKRQSKILPLSLMKRIGIEYYNAIRM